MPLTNCRIGNRREQYVREQDSGDRYQVTGAAQMQINTVWVLRTVWGGLRLSAEPAPVWLRSASLLARCRCAFLHPSVSSYEVNLARCSKNDGYETATQSAPSIDDESDAHIAITAEAIAIR